MKALISCNLRLRSNYTRCYSVKIHSLLMLLQVLFRNQKWDSFLAYSDFIQISIQVFVLLTELRSEFSISSMLCDKTIAMLLYLTMIIIDVCLASFNLRPKQNILYVLNGYLSSYKLCFLEVKKFKAWND